MAASSRPTALLIALLVLVATFVAVQASQPIWVYSDWDADCKQTQCGYGLLDRQATCVEWDTGAQQPPSACEAFYGPAVEVMECVYSEPDPTIACGGQFGRKAFDCKYNEAFDPNNLDDKYMTCHCKPGWTGTYCEIPPAPGPDPGPGPEPTPDPSKKGGLTIGKILIGLLIVLAVVALAAGAWIVIMKFKRRSSAKGDSISVSPINTGPYIDMESNGGQEIYS